ncbi:MAG TPA: ankyrin repeat domain-containing protein, partial [Gammaproteobacteria bacterium]
MNAKPATRAAVALLLAALAGVAAAQVPLAPRADEVPSSPLAEAAQRGDAAAVRALLEAGGVDVDAPSRDGTPPLHWAVRAGDRDSVERLLAAGADVN